MKAILAILLCGLACQAQAQDVQSHATPAYDNVHKAKAFKKSRSINAPLTDSSAKRRSNPLPGKKDEVNLQNKNIRK
jgi:hypothetical protein